MAAAAMHVRDAYLGQLAWIFYRKRAQTNRIEQLKDCRVSADSKRQRQDGDEGKARIQPKRANAVANILPQARRKRSKARSARRFCLRMSLRLDSTQFAGETVVLVELRKHCSLSLVRASALHQQIAITVFHVQRNFFNNAGFTRGLKIQTG